MFEHTYGKSISRDLWVEHGKELLHAARKFGFNTLSDSAESWYLRFLHLTVNNAIYELIYADSNNYPVLKDEVVVHFITKNLQDILASESFARLYERQHLLTEVMVTMGVNNQSNKKLRPSW